MRLPDGGEPGQVLVRDESAEGGWRWAYAEDAAEGPRSDRVKVAIIVVNSAIIAAAVMWALYIVSW